MKAWPIAWLLGLTCAAQAQMPGQATAHAPDGGTTEREQSISIPPLTNAPFSAIVETELTSILADGSTATVKNRRTVARDNSGRIFEERRRFSPTGDKQPSMVTALQYMDPARHEFYNCMPAQRTCYLSTYQRSALTAMPAGSGGLQACGCTSHPGAGTSVQQEALGQKTMEEVDVIGSREITTLPAGQFGNQKPEPIVKEFWYSPRLGINLVTKRFDPRAGIQNFLVEDLSLNEPDPKMFEPPPDYKVVRQTVERPGTAPNGR